MIFWVEMQKARRRHDLLLCLLVPLIILLWVGGLSPESEEELANGYSALFYSLPVMHSILLPVAMAALASPSVGYGGQGRHDEAALYAAKPPEPADGQGGLRAAGNGVDDGD